MTRKRKTNATVANGLYGRFSWLWQDVGVLASWPRAVWALCVLRGCMCCSGVIAVVGVSVCITGGVGHGTCGGGGSMPRVVEVPSGEVVVVVVGTEHGQSACAVRLLSALIATIIVLVRSHLGSRGGCIQHTPGSRTSIMPPKKIVQPKIPASVVKQVTTFSTKKADTEEQEFIDKVVAHLQAHPREAKPCFWSLEAGVFSQKQLMKQHEIPSSRTHLHLLSNKFMAATLTAMEPEIMCEAVLAPVRKHHPKELLRMFNVATDTNPKDEVFTRNIEIFQSTYRDVNHKLGRRLRSIEIDAAGNVSYDGALWIILHGEPEGDEPPLHHLMHVTGFSVHVLLCRFTEIFQSTYIFD